MFIWRIVLLCLLLVSFSGASIFLLSSSGPELKQSSILNDEIHDIKSSSSENANLPTFKDVQSRLDILESANNLLINLNGNQKEEILQLKNEIDHQKEDIRQLRDENKNRKEETWQIKSVMDRLIIIGCASNQELSGMSIDVSKGNNTKIHNKVGARLKRQANAEGEANSALWAKLGVSDHVIGYMDYDSYSIKMFDKFRVNMKNEEKKYYFEPTGQLDHRSAKSAFNNISKKAEMTFNVNMWSDSIRNAVHKFIADDLKRGPVNINLVRVLPMDRVMLFNEIGASQHFEIGQNWINYKGDKFLKFKYTCEKLKECNDLAMQMQNNPEQFHFNMKFGLSAQKPQTKDTKISMESIIHGKMLNTLNQKFPEKKFVILTENGKKQLLEELSENIIIQTFDDDQVPTKNSRGEIYRKLESMLRFNYTTIQKGDEKEWKENVFWDQDNYRPDVSARIVNDIYNKLDSESQKKFDSAFYDSKKEGHESEGSFFDFLNDDVKVSSDFSREHFDSKESMQQFLNEATYQVEWDGVRFVPKQMTLHALNMARLRNKQAFKDTDIRISYTTSMLTIGVRHDSTLDPKTSSELFELENKVSGLTDSFNSLVADINAEINNVKAEFQKEIKEFEHVKKGKGLLLRAQPSSCEDLKTIGHYLNGFYAIKDKSTEKVQNVYCQFESSGIPSQVANGLHCYQCDSSEDIRCSEELTSPDLQPLPCDTVLVSEPRYCIKMTGIFGGNLGAKRFCSGRFLDNYCTIVRRPGDQQEYRSCVYTCEENGCNG